MVLYVPWFFAFIYSTLVRSIWPVTYCYIISHGVLAHTSSCLSTPPEVDIQIISSSPQPLWLSVLPWTSLLVSSIDPLSSHPGTELLRHGVCVECEHVLTRLLPGMTAPVSTPANTTWGLLDPTTSSTFAIFHFPNFIFPLGDRIVVLIYISQVTSEFEHLFKYFLAFWFLSSLSTFSAQL